MGNKILPGDDAIFKFVVVNFYDLLPDRFPNSESHLIRLTTLYYLYCKR